MTTWWGAARSNPLFLMVVIIAGAIFIGDQLSKLWILHGLDLPSQLGIDRFGRERLGHVNLGPIMDLSYVENRGVSFGLFAGGIVSRVLLTLLALVISGFVLHWAGRLNRKAAAIGAGLIIGGALGNAIDRIFYGFVVDFIDFASIGFPWVFNIADSAINIGVAFLAYDAFIVAPKLNAAPKDADPSPEMSSSSYEGSETPPSQVFPEEVSPSIKPEDPNSRSPE